MTLFKGQQVSIDKLLVENAEQREQASKAEHSHQNSGGVDVSTIVKDAAPIVEGIIAAL